MPNTMNKPRLTENAVKNHEELFPNLESNQQKADPEFIALFDNWAFDEVIRQSQLDVKTRVMMILASTNAPVKMPWEGKKDRLEAGPTLLADGATARSNASFPVVNFWSWRLPWGEGELSSNSQ